MSAVVPFNEADIYLIPKLEPAKPSGLNARVASVQVFHSADVATSIIPCAVVLAETISPT